MSGYFRDRVQGAGAIAAHAPAPRAAPAPSVRRGAGYLTVGAFDDGPTIPGGPRITSPTGPSSGSTGGKPTQLPPGKTGRVPSLQPHITAGPHITSGPRIVPPTVVPTRAPKTMPSMLAAQPVKPKMLPAILQPAAPKPKTAPPGLLSSLLAPRASRPSRSLPGSRTDLDAPPATTTPPKSTPKSGTIVGGGGGGGGGGPAGSAPKGGGTLGPIGPLPGEDDDGIVQSATTAVAPAGGAKLWLVLGLGGTAAYLAYRHLSKKKRRS